jgi:hypothetical protein
VWLTPNLSNFQRTDSLPPMEEFSNWASTPRTEEIASMCERGLLFCIGILIAELMAEFNNYFRPPSAAWGGRISGLDAHCA